MPCCQWHGDDLLLFVKTQPQASKDELLDIVNYENAPIKSEFALTLPRQMAKPINSCKNF